MLGKITTILAKKEAEAYRSQGLHKEAAKLFKNLLADNPGIDQGIRTAIETQLRGIQAEMADVDQERERSLSPQEIARIRDGWGESVSEADLLVCAQAFAKIGAHKEALAELHKLLSKGHLKKIYLIAAADSFVELHPPKFVAKAAAQWTQSTGQPRKAVVAMQLAMAKQMEARRKWRHALAIYHLLHRIPALAPYMKPRIDNLNHQLDSPKN